MASSQPYSPRQDRTGRAKPQDRDYSGSDRAYRNAERGRGRDVETDETSTLISSSKVEGTAVYGHDGDRLGTIYNFMVDKRSGRVAYAVLSFGGFLGMGQNYYPIPWDMLEYDPRMGGYVVDIDEDDLDNAPSYRRGQEPAFDNRYTSMVYGYYGVPY